MKKTLKIGLVLYFLMTNFMLFAQLGGGPGDDDNNGSTGLEGGDPPAAPINVWIWLFIIIAIAYAYLVFKRINRVKWAK